MTLKSRQKLGKFRVERKLAEGGFAAVYRAYDTIEGVRVALKVPHPHMLERAELGVFRKEVRVNARLDHPNILPIKYADFIDDRFVIVYPLGTESLESRLRRRVARRKALDWAGQMLDAVAFAHRRKILHSDLKPENFILFPGDQIRLADFGLARISHRTLSASGSGTVGYLAPEQALGRPSLRSDVFSLGLILYRLFTGALPAWPFDWPPPRHARLLRDYSDGMSEVLRRALEIDHRLRFPDAQRFRTAFQRVRAGTSRRIARRRRSARAAEPGWEMVRLREFQRKYRTELDTRHACPRCDGPVSEPMRACPWCGSELAGRRFETRFPDRCGRCGRGRKLDWRFCPWCYGSGFDAVADRSYSDRRYTARCGNRSCPDGRQMPFMRYCPWCRRKVRRRWAVSGATRRCGGCGHDVLPDYWSHCPWCARRIAKR